ncbi:MAG TPA: glycosyltransferase family 4 protein [Blastocatellia bacterium]|nr:glycosyltransferase family 4 protein [Blastocatellia bacterium]
MPKPELNQLEPRPLRILVLNQYFPPDTAATAMMAARIVQHLARRHRVTVIAGRPSYNPTDRHGLYLWRREHLGSVTVLRVGSTACSRYRMRNRLANYLSYLVLAFLRALWVKADVIIAMTDPPIIGLVAALVARFRRCPFVYNIRDLHPDMALASGLITPAWWVTLWERLHRWILKEAACVIVLGEDMRRRVLSKGVTADKIAVVRDGAEVSTLSPPPDHPIVRELRANFPFVVLHAGNLGHYGAWETVVKAVKLLEDENLGVVFVGEGAARERILTLAGGCPRIRFFPFRPVEEVPYVLAAGDIHLVTMRRGLDGLVVPSKFYGIVAAGRPVLAVVPRTSDIARIVEQSGCGIVVDPEDPSSLAAVIRDLLHHPERVDEMARCARVIAPQFILDHHLERFVFLIEQIARATSHAQEVTPCGINGMFS